jgi:DNA-binding NarL/FixJ family response regulator
MENRTAVVVDAQPIWREAVERVLRSVGVEVVAKGRLESALTFVENHRPGVLIFGAGSESEYETDLINLKRVSASFPELTAIVVSDKDDEEAVSAAFTAGASIFCVRKAEREDLAAAVRLAVHKTIFMSMSFRSQYEMSSRSTEEESNSVLLGNLTRRETEILRLVAEGHSNAQLAKMLWVTEQTVKFHLSNVYRKLYVSNRTEAARWAQVNGLLSSSTTSVQQSPALMSLR